MHLKKKKRRKKNILAVWRLSGSVLSQWFFVQLGVLYVMKHSKMNGTLSESRAVAMRFEVVRLQ